MKLALGRCTALIALFAVTFAGMPTESNAIDGLHKNRYSIKKNLKLGSTILRENVKIELNPLRATGASASFSSSSMLVIKRPEIPLNIAKIQIPRTEADFCQPGEINMLSSCAREHHAANNNGGSLFAQIKIRQIAKTVRNLLNPSFELIKNLANDPLVDDVSLDFSEQSEQRQSMVPAKLATYKRVLSPSPMSKPPKNQPLTRLPMGNMLIMTSEAKPAAKSKFIRSAGCMINDADTSAFPDPFLFETRLPAESQLQSIQQSELDNNQMPLIKHPLRIESLEQSTDETVSEFTAAVVGIKYFAKAISRKVRPWVGLVHIFEFHRHFETILQEIDHVFWMSSLERIWNICGLDCGQLSTPNLCWDWPSVR